MDIWFWNRGFIILRYGAERESWGAFEGVREYYYPVTVPINSIFSGILFSFEGGTDDLKTSGLINAHILAATAPKS